MGAEFYNHRGLAYFRQKRMKDSLEDLNQALGHNDKEPVFYFNRGNIYYEIQEFEKAHADYDVAIRMEPNNPQYWHSKGQAFEGVDAEGNIEQAIRMFKQALLIEPEYFGA